MEKNESYFDWKKTESRNELLLKDNGSTAMCVP